MLTINGLTILLKGGFLVEDVFHEMDLLSRQMNQAHRAAVQAELNAAGLEEIHLEDAIADFLAS